MFPGKRPDLANNLLHIQSASWPSSAVGQSICSSPNDLNPFESRMCDNMEHSRGPGN